MKALKEMTVEKAAEKAVSLSLPLKSTSWEGLALFALSYTFIGTVAVATLVK